MTASAPCSRLTPDNKYTATGVIQWMLNNAWPSLIWHLYDYYLVPAGGYFGTKKANEPSTCNTPTTTIPSRS